jgi:ATP-dependent Clp protease adaptor protein ClpS
MNRGREVPGGGIEAEIEAEARTQLEAPCKVILFNDEEHTYDYVVDMLVHASRLSRENAFRCAVEVDLTGRTIVHYGSLDECETVRSRIIAYGPDHRLPQSMSSMNAEVQGC